MAPQWLFVVFLHLLTPLASVLADNGTARGPASNQLLFYMGNKKESMQLTTGWGAPSPDRGNVLTVGPRGPMLLQDLPFIEEMQRFNRERIPERVVHAKGAGAFGYFTVTDDITRFCKASVFSKIGKKTPLAVRFSTFVGSSGSSDTVRDTRGFALKFYTEEGNWDLLGNNSPVFFVRDPYLTFSYAHSQKKNPVTHLTDRDAGFDFISLQPQTLHQVMFLFSDRGIPDGFRHIDGYGINTFKLVNAAGSAVYCKFNYKTDQGIKNLWVEEASRLAGTDPDYAIRDLYNAIAEGRHPSWTFYIQVMTFDQAETLPWNPFDATKSWPVDEFPLIRVGKFVLTKNPNNYFVDVEQLGFSPGRMVPGIEASPDKLLQGRLNLYSDAQLYRLGTNYLQLPVNSPHHVFNTQRDGEACYTDNQDGQPNYYPSSFINQMNSPRARIHPYPTHGVVKRYNSSDDDNFTQPRRFWLSFSEDEKLRTATNIASSLKNALGFIQERALKNFHEVDPRLANLVKAALNVQS